MRASKMAARKATGVSVTAAVLGRARVAGDLGRGAAGQGAAVGHLPAEPVGRAAARTAQRGIPGRAARRRLNSNSQPLEPSAERDGPQAPWDLNS